MNSLLFWFIAEAVGGSCPADGEFLLDAAAVRAVLRADSHRFRTSQVRVAGRASIELSPDADSADGGPDRCSIKSVTGGAMPSASL